MSNLTIIILPLVVILAVIVAAFVLFVKISNHKKIENDNIQSQTIETLRMMMDVQDKRLEEMTQKMNQRTIENKVKLNNIRSTLETRLSSIQKENNSQLDKMRETVDEKLQKTLEERISQSFKIVNDQLDKVSKGFGEMQALASNVGDLKRVLSNIKTRGNLGEIQLRAILQEIMALEQYEENVRPVPGSKNVVEFAVKLPGDGEVPVYLPIDSKFPGDTYETLLDAYESGDKEGVEAAQKSLIKVLKQEGKDIREKYVQPPYTTDFAIMFLPVEGLYAEAVKLGMVEELQKTEYKINIAGPTTMAAMLNSLQMGFKTLSIQKYSSEVWDTLAGVKAEFNTFAENLEKVRANLKTADNRLEKLIGTRTRAIQRKLKNVEVMENYDRDKFIGEFEIEEDIDDE